MNGNIKQRAAATCPDCGVRPGTRHQEGCDVARCVVCGEQQLQCDPAANHGLTGDATPPMQIWTGSWPRTYD